MLLHLVNDLLDVFQLKNSQFVKNPVYFSMKKSIKSVFSMIEYQAKEKGIDLIVEIDEDL